MNMTQLQSALNIGRSSAYALIKSNIIAHIRIGNTIRIPKSELQNYIQNSLQMCYNGLCSDRASTSCQKGECLK